MLEDEHYVPPVVDEIEAERLQCEKEARAANARGKLQPRHPPNGQEPREAWTAYSPALLQNHPCLDFSLKNLSRIPKPTGLQDFTHPLVNAAPDAACGICNDDFGAVAGIALDVCDHTYHFECLNELYKSERTRFGFEFRCGCCSKMVCTEDSMDGELDKFTHDGDSVPFWLTVGHYLKARRGDHV
ncbi:hypothetical protein CC86DRAFT_411324 [Ophiobolus disseminans]|uniref:RING-type domain-containing protein n=1 Tax=Ophiobolus disseminans TaxID=1469910 RepID=A0A6A6ZJE0_9PLEO|nr:hypothetical protein CC86DRAFT_411324 [Ophiobolus disseminans]